MRYLANSTKVASMPSVESGGGRYQLLSSICGPRTASASPRTGSYLQIWKDRSVSARQTCSVGHHQKRTPSSSHNKSNRSISHQSRSSNGKLVGDSFPTVSPGSRLFANLTVDEITAQGGSTEQGGFTEEGGFLSREDHDKSIALTLTDDAIEKKTLTTRLSNEMEQLPSPSAQTNHHASIEIDRPEMAKIPRDGGLDAIEVCSPTASNHTLTVVPTWQSVAASEFDSKSMTSTEMFFNTERFVAESLKGLIRPSSTVDQSATAAKRPTSSVTTGSHSVQNVKATRYKSAAHPSLRSPNVICHQASRPVVGRPRKSRDYGDTRRLQTHSDVVKRTEQQQRGQRSSSVTNKPQSSVISSSSSKTPFVSSDCNSDPRTSNTSTPCLTQKKNITQLIPTSTVT